MLTRRGAASLGLTAALIAAAALFGVQELYALATAGLLVLGASTLWAHSRTWDLAVDRRLVPARVPAGRPANVEITLSNQLVRPSPVVGVRDPFDGGRSAAELLVAPLRAGENRSATYRLPTAQRGVYVLGPLELVLHDPWGLVSLRRAGAPRAYLTVHPRVEPLRWLPMISGNARQDAGGTPAFGRVGEEFFALRDYRSGDDLRLVHWMSTARLDQLMIRQSESRWRGRLTVVVDLRRSVHDSASLEAALSAAASIADTGLRQDVHVRLLTTAGIDSGFGVGPTHRAVVLDALAAASTHPSGTGYGYPPADTGPLTFITTAAAQPDELAGLLGAAAPGSRRRAETTVVVIDRTLTGMAPQLAGRLAALAGRTVQVAPGGSFGAAWDGALDPRLGAPVRP